MHSSRVISAVLTHKTYKIMAKIYGLFGAMTGKVADAVMVVRNGEQIVRKYQPVVSNPNTPAQIEVRAKLKLMSQLSAVMSPYIAMRREGTVSRRNLFVKKNYPTVTFANNKADINLLDVKLTKGVLAFPTITTSRQPDFLTVSINEVSAQNFDRVVYVMFERQDGGSLRHAADAVVVKSSSNNNFSTQLSMPSTNSRVVVYAYGIRDNSEAARVAFANLNITTPEMVANIVTSRYLLESDITLSETRAVLSPQQE